MRHHSLRARLFVFFDKNLRRFIHLIFIIHVGFWFGIFNRKQSDSATELFYAQSLKQYQEREYNESGLKGWEAHVIETYFKDVVSVLVASSGGGREILALSKAGYKVDGFECAVSLVDYSRDLSKSEAIDTKILLAEPSRVPEGLGSYDAVIIGWGAYMHIRGKKTRVDFLKQLRLHIKTDNPILISFLIREDNRKYLRIYRVAKFVAYLSRNKDPIELGDTINGTYEHFFTREEIENELSEGGFELISLSSDYYSPYAVARAV